MEKAARIEAEERLREAEVSVGRLHCNIVEGGTKYTTEKKTEMTSDVNKLKGNLSQFILYIKKYNIQDKIFSFHCFYNFFLIYHQ